MKKFVNLSLTALCMATLVACSSGGGSSSSEQANTGGTTNAGGSTNTGSTNTGSTNTGSTNTGSTNTGSTTPTTPATPAPQNIANVAAAGLKNATVTADSITVDGKQVRLSLPGVYGGGKILAGNIEIVKMGSGFEYFGFASEGRGKQRYAYYGSSQPETSVMPVAGTASYEGKAVYSYGGVIAPNKFVAEGNIKLSADFANKTLAGTIDNAVGGTGTQNQAQVKGNISGSGFTGKVSTPSASADLAGKFYGTDAASVAGVFGDAGNNLSGAFQADKK